MPVTMNGLRALHQSMRAQDMDRYRYEYSHGQATFDVIFLADESPYILLLGLRGGSIAFEFKVDEQYVIQSVYMGDDYSTLVKLLGLRYDPNNRFRPTHFLEWVDKAAPAQADTRSAPRPAHVVRFRREVEEEKKVYFLSWRHYRNDERGPTLENLAKTRKLLGYRYYVICRDRQISSCWTDIAADERATPMPE